MHGFDANLVWIFLWWTPPDLFKIRMLPFLYARHLTDVLWYGSVRTSVRPYVRTSVRSVVHNPCGQDIARTIWPRMLKLSMYT